MQLTADLTHLPLSERRSVMRNLQHEDAAQHALGVIRQIRLKKLYDAVAVPGFNGELRMKMIIDDDQAARARAQYGDLCMMDPDFVNWLLRKNEDMRVKDVGTRIQSGWTPASAGGFRHG